MAKNDVGTADLNFDSSRRRLQLDMQYRVGSRFRDGPTKDDPAATSDLPVRDLDSRRERHSTILVHDTENLAYGHFGLSQHASVGTRATMVVRFFIFIFICVAALVVLVAGPAIAERRVALVIGNGNYAKVPKLANPTNDAAAIDALLKAASFDKVVRAEDLGAAQLRRALRDFSDEAKDADIAVVFYAGHGMEMNGNNYLIPVDAALERDVDVEDETISLERVGQAIEGARRLKLIILDACRDNPFTRSIKRTILSRSFGRGLARVDVSSSDTLVAYAAKAGSTALDGDEKNSPYTRALLTHLTTPGLDVRLALGRVRDDVMRITNRKQEPFVYGSLGGAEQPLSSNIGPISSTQGISFGIATLADLTDRVAPAVVKVRTSKLPFQSMNISGLSDDHPLNRFFRSGPQGSTSQTGIIYLT